MIWFQTVYRATLNEPESMGIEPSQMSLAAPFVSAQASAAMAVPYFLLPLVDEDLLRS